MEKEILQKEINAHDGDNAGSEEVTEEDVKSNGGNEPAGDNRRPGFSSNAKPQKRSKIKKWTLLIVAGLILAVSGLGIKFAPDLFNMHDTEILANVDINDPDLSEEALSPFFIPPAKGNANGAIRIDLSVVWDGLASIRYRKKEIQIRSALYRQLTEIAGQNNDLNNSIPFLENRISALFRESLGAGTLVVKVKEIRYI